MKWMVISNALFPQNRTQKLKDLWRPMKMLVRTFVLAAFAKLLDR